VRAEVLKTGPRYNPLVTRRNSPDTLKALVDALRFDPFYAAISQTLDDDEARRREVARYFDYSMSEGDRRGRLVVWPDPAIGAAVWLLPATRHRVGLHDSKQEPATEFSLAFARRKPSGFARPRRIQVRL
jgi:hypothetical protein